MSSAERHRFEELKEAYALSALAEDERREVELLLAAHPDWRAEVEELGAVAALLALTPEEQEPSAQLRGKIMRSVEAEARTARPWPGFARIRELFAARRLVLGTAALLLVGLLSWNVFLNSELNELRNRNEELQARVQQPQEVVLTGTEAAEGVRAEVVVLRGRKPILTAENMPPVPESKTMQIWVIKDGVPEPSGVFDPDSGPVAAVVENPVRGADAIAVTVEPEGGSEQPTSDPMLLAEL